MKVHIYIVYIYVRGNKNIQKIKTNDDFTTHIFKMSRISKTVYYSSTIYLTASSITFSSTVYIPIPVPCCEINNFRITQIVDFRIVQE